MEPFLVIFLYLVFFARQWGLEKFAILSLKPRSHARILNTERGLFFFTFLRTEKSSFNYLLIDPRVTQNLPVRAKKMDPDDVFRVFVMAIFYVGKGKRSRPYAHLNEALQSSKVRSNQKYFSPWIAIVDNADLAKLVTLFLLFQSHVLMRVRPRPRVFGFFWKRRFFSPFSKNKRPHAVCSKRFRSSSRKRLNNGNMM